MRTIRQAISILMALSLTVPAVAGEMRYVAKLNHSMWQVESSRLHCSLSHEIPHYGRAVFESADGGDLSFRIEVRRKPRAVGVARVVSAVPEWNHETRVRDLGQVNYSTEKAPFRLGDAMARRLLLELERGMFPTFSYQDWADGRDRIDVALSAVNVRQSLDEFLLCLDNRIGFGFDEVRVSRIQFGFDSSDLSAVARQRLDKVAEYLTADPAVRKVTLEGLTDNKGFRSYNLALAKRRAGAVRDYLVGRGVKPGQFQIRAVGERYNIASNRTAKGRAMNRAVIVTLAK